jgi:growth factor-regulated tyrosine kinase substrate
MFSMFSSSPLDALVEEATSELLPGAQEDLAKNMEICDSIKGRAVQPNSVVKSLKRRLLHYNPNVQLLAIKLCDAIVKNGGRAMAKELSGREFVDCVLSIIANPSTNRAVQQLAADSVQQWAAVFSQYPADLQFLPSQLALFKREHPEIVFPEGPADLAIDMMAECMEPPEWTDNPNCQRCRLPFTITNRKHHCRACGLTYCGQCTVKTKALPEIGYVQPVRVCDACYYDQGEDRRASDNDDLGLAIQRSLQDKQQQQHQFVTPQHVPILLSHNMDYSTMKRLPCKPPSRPQSSKTPLLKPQQPMPKHSPTN